MFGAVGWVDDYRKVVERDSRGLPARWKYLWQSVAGLGAALYLYLAFDTPVTTELYIPFSRISPWSMGPLFVVLAYFVIVGASNAVNLTDGLDGLAILPTVMVGTALVSSPTSRGMRISPGTCTSPTWLAAANSRCSAARSPAPVSASSGSTPIPPRYSWAMWARWRWARRWALWR